MKNMLARFGLVLSMGLSGCAISYVDDEGRHNVVGFVNISMQGVKNNQLKAGDKVEISNLGILIMSGQVHSGLSIGYNKEETMSIKNDVLILIDKKPNGNNDEIKDID